MLLTMVIDGRKIANELITRLKESSAPKKFLTAVMVGGDAASASFVKQKERTARELGVDFRIQELEGDIAKDVLIKKLKGLGENENCGGIILQLPLPAHINREFVIEAIPIEKDVDALRGGDLALSPAVGVVEEVFKITNYQLPITTAAIVGLGFLVGKPIAAWLKDKVSELITLDLGDDLARLKDADVVILGTGKAGLVKPEMLKGGALIIDFGYSRGPDGKLHGDFDSSYKLSVISPELAYTPTPGGTGPILVAKLFENFYQLNQR